MKKILIALTIVISCLGISRVSADNLQLELYGYDYFVEFKSFFGEEEFTNIINDMIEVYKNNYYSSYPYFDILLSNTRVDSKDYYSLTLNYYKDKPSTKWSWALSQGIGWTSINLYIDNSSNYFQRSYYFDDNVLKYDNSNYYSSVFIIRTRDGRNVPNYDTDGAWYRYTPYNYYYSNYDLILDPIGNYENKYDNTFNPYGTAYLYNYDNFLIPKINEPTISTVVSYDKTDYIIEPYYLYDNNNLSMFNYTEINLNDYAYVALALKDYSKKAFETTIQVKGQYCLTPIYNYGMTERKDILTGTQVDRCSPYYENYTPIRTYILDNDLKNNAIYYLKSYDTTRDNYIKVDTSVFDVTYVTEENKDNPYVTIGGKTYPTIPYDNLTDTATKSEEEGYVSGAVEEFSFSDIFTAPLEFLKDIWSSIVSVFDLVKEFFSLLPEPIPTFLLSSFLLGLAIGLLKLIF